MDSTLPPRLSDRQQFVLAWIAVQGRRAGARTLSRATAAEFDGLEPKPARGTTRKPMTATHRSTHSTTLNRLAERGLIERRPDAIALTDDGRAAGEEILRRHRDGRYSLEFETID